MPHFLYKKNRKQISVLLIVALMLGMVSNNFAITDFDSHNDDEKKNYYEEMVNEASNSIVCEENEEEELIEEYVEEPEEDVQEEIEENIESEEQEKVDEDIFASENETEEMCEEEVEEDNETLNEQESEINEEENDEEIVATENEVEELLEESIATDNEVQEELGIVIATDVEIENVSTPSMPLLSMIPLFGDTATHYHDTTLYTAIYNESDLSSITTSYLYLANDLEINNSISLSHFDNNKLNICLNGKTITFAYDKNIFDIGDDEELTITDCSSTSGHIKIATFDETYDERKTLINVQGTGKVNIKKINIGALEFYGTMFEAADGGCINVSDINMEECSYTDTAFYAHGNGSKINFLGNNHILNNAAFDGSILFADNEAEIEILSGDTVFEGNVGKTGGIVKLTNHSKFTIEGNLIASSNEAEKGGFAYVDNTASFYSSSGEINIENSYAEYGGGLYIDVINTESFIDNTLVYNIKNNTASGAGGGVYLYFNIDGEFAPDMQGTFNFYKNTSLHGAGLFVSSATGKNAYIKNLCFYEHSLTENESLIEVDANAIIDSLKIESINKAGDTLGNLVSIGTLIRAIANNNVIRITNINLSNDSDKMNRAYKGIELSKESTKTIDLTISTYSLVDKIAFGIDISHIEDDGISKVKLSHIYTNFTTNNDRFKVPLAEDFPKPDNFYTALSSLTGNGTKALSLDYLPGFNTRWDIRYKFGSTPKSIGAWPYTGGTYYDNGTNQNQRGRFGFLGLNSNQIQCAFGYAANSYSYYCKTSQVHTMYIDAYNRKSSNGVDSANQGSRGMNFTTNGRFKNAVSRLYIFGASSNTGSTRTPHKGTVYWTKISESGVVVRDFIPIKLTKDIPKSMDHYGVSRSAGSTGLWDQVEEEFYEYESGVVTSETTETGINIYDSKIPVILDNLKASGAPKKLLYVDSSKNIDIVDMSIENTSAQATMEDTYIKVVENSEINFSGTTNVKNNTIQKNSIIDIKNNSKAVIKDTADFSDNTCTLNTDRQSSVICIEHGAELYIKTEDISFTGNLTKKGVIGIYDDAKLYIHGHFYILDNHIYADATKTLNIYLGSANSCIYYDAVENSPIKTTSKIGVTNGSLNSVIFNNWGKDSIEGYNDGSDVSKAIYLPDDLFIRDTSHVSANQYIYKQGVLPETKLYLGTNCCKLDYVYGTDIIGSQYIAKNIETTVDSIYLIGTPSELQGWEGPSVLNENEYVFWGVTDGTRTAKISANKNVKISRHNHLICGDLESDNCSHNAYKISADYIFANDSADFLYKLKSYKNVYLVKDIKVTSKVILVNDGLYNICLNGYTLTFENGVNIIEASGNKKLTICNCKDTGSVIISSISQIGNSPAIKIQNGDFALINAKVKNQEGIKTPFVDISGAESHLYINDVEFSNNNILDGNFLNVNAIQKATFSNVKVASNSFTGQASLVNISDTNVYLDAVDIYDNIINQGIIIVKNVSIDILSNDEYKVHDNQSSAGIVAINGNLKVVGATGKKYDNTVGTGIYYLKNANDITIEGLVCEDCDRAIYIENSGATLKNVNIKNSGAAGIDGGAIYILKGSCILDSNIILENNVNAIFNDGGKLYIRNPQNTTIDPNIEIKNGTGTYVLSSSKENGAEYYLLGGKIYQNTTDNIYIKKDTNSLSTEKNIVFYIGGNFVTEVENGKRGIHVTDHIHEIFKEFQQMGLTDDNRLSYYVENNGTRIFSNLNNTSIDRNTVFIIEDKNRDPERPMYLDQYEDTKDLYIYYKSIAIQYKRKITDDGSVGDLNLQQNSHLPRRVLYNSATPVTIGRPVLSGYRFDGWEGPGIATPGYMDDIVLEGLTDMTIRCYTACFTYIPVPDVPTFKTRSGGGGGGGGGAGLKSGNSADSVTPKQSNAKPIPQMSKQEYVLPSDCTWIYDPVGNTWSLNIKRDGTEFTMKDGFCSIVSLDSEGNLVYDTYCFDENGYMIKGWAKNGSGDLYYFDELSINEKGKMAVGWKEIGPGKLYYFNVDGKLLVNSITPDGNVVGSDGLLVKPNIKN